MMRRRPMEDALPRDVGQFMHAYTNAVSNGDDNRLRVLFRGDPPNTALIAHCKNISIGALHHQVDQANLEEKWTSAAFHFLAAQPFIVNQRYVEAYDNYAKMYAQLALEFGTPEGGWLGPLLQMLTVSLRQLAELADNMLIQERKKIEKIEDAERKIKKVLSHAMTDRSAAGRRKENILYLMNNLFKIYFKLNNIKLCKNLLAYLKTPGFPNMETFSIAQRLTFNYYHARYLMYIGSYTEAYTKLTYAVQRCPLHYANHRRQLMILLIPCGMLKKKLPTQELLDKYGLEPIFYNIVLAIKLGDPALFKQTMTQNQGYFISAGIFLALEKLIYLVYRRLLKQVYLIGAATSKKASLVPLDNFRTALALRNVEKDRAQVECIVANLIHQKYIKGYIARAHNILVMADPINAAFPPLE